MSQASNPKYSDLVREAEDLLKDAHASLYKSTSRQTPGYMPWRRQAGSRDPVSIEVVQRFARLVVLRTLYATDQTAKLSPDSHEFREFEERAYRLAVSDLFVETALDSLERKAVHYKIGGIAAYVISVLAIVFGVVASFDHAQPFAKNQTEHRSNQPVAPALVLVIPTVAATSPSISASAVAPNGSAATPLAAIPSDSIVKHAMWFNLASAFARSFTFYGFVVLSAVTLWRFGRAMLDQSERLNDRRHALRQGRLFLHLRNGEVAVDEMVAAFAWNIQQPNAFASMPTEAKAPWGGAFADLARATSDIAKAGADSLRRERRQ